MGVRFVLNGRVVDVPYADAAPHVSALHWLRSQGQCGSKEGCAEGECGACAVALLSTAPGERGSHFEAVNSCLLPLAALEGRELVTVEGVAAADGSLHPVQAAMVETGGSQCGYCTPGFVVSLFCEYYRPGRTAFDPESISGNLCRCTGYRPIADVARGMPSPSPQDPRLIQLRRAAPRIATGKAQPEARFFRPESLHALWALFERYPNATAIAGGTDLMVYANQRHQRWPQLISLEALPELAQLSVTEHELILGAGVPLDRIEHTLANMGGHLLGQLWPLFSSRLIRHRATLGGNLGTASPIGDSAPALLALGAELELVSRAGVRRLPLAEFFTGYRKTVLAPAELIQSVRVPRPMPQIQRFYKVSKRVLDDISTVAGAFALSLDRAGKVERLGIAFGGVAATPLLASSLEQLALGRLWDTSTLALLLTASEQLGTPQSDLRGSAAYRRAMIGKLLEKFFHESHAREAAE